MTLQIVLGAAAFCLGLAVWTFAAVTIAIAIWSVCLGLADHVRESQSPRGLSWRRTDVTVDR